ncbi:hypothetical protein HYPSUDRAFT_202046 [Hypholoma sublateritium FD-334 SS-4]|uniref:Uncharacterized protein n=1 Tax=Hypholoma sublateritium (strain FD-334 SS-4) TaxID=945553 RepID=A0A0D2PRJ8_HYPSF|nr:hypothetical protein HYPSUDRAFT_202046 [Hypholoma sublateritium FD-334 SS-4]
MAAGPFLRGDQAVAGASLAGDWALRVGVDRGTEVDHGDECIAIQVITERVALLVEFDLRQSKRQSCWYLHVHGSRARALAPPRRAALPACAAPWMGCARFWRRARRRGARCGRGVAALDVRSCTGVVVLPSGVEDNVAAAASGEGGQDDHALRMDTLSVVHVLYADGVERIAAESPAAAARWGTRIRAAIAAADTHALASSIESAHASDFTQ